MTAKTKISENTGSCSHLRMVPTETLSSLGNVFDFTRSTREFSSSFMGPFCKISCRMRTSDQLHVTKKKLAQSLFFSPLFPAPAARISYSGPHIIAGTVHHVYYELSGQLKAPTNYALIGPHPGLQIIDAKKADLSLPSFKPRCNNRQSGTPAVRHQQLFVLWPRESSR